tara:strand:+ start:7584 stop:8075 length:492 start_codon:yes stop_codon:yes gene_type:complete
MKLLKTLLRNFIRGESIHELYERSRVNYARGGIYRRYSYHLERKIIRNFGCYLSKKAIIGKNVKFRHPVGIVIGDGVTIGNDVLIYQNVTLGAARIGEGAKGFYPQIANGVTIFAGAKILGSITIGENSSIGANAVVLKDVPPNSIAVGIPAKILSPLRDINC